MHVNKCGCVGIRPHDRESVCTRQIDAWLSSWGPHYSLRPWFGSCFGGGISSFMLENRSIQAAGSGNLEICRLNVNRKFDLKNEAFTC